MYSRIIKYPGNKSFFLFGPRGTGKTTWVKKAFPNAVYLDLLESRLFNELLADPQRLENFIPVDFKDLIIIDEVQKIPELLNEVHRLIEKNRYKFILTGSSARKLRRKGPNLLAGRALNYSMHPLTAIELGKDLNLNHSLIFGHLPSVYVESNPGDYLESYFTLLEDLLLAYRVPVFTKRAKRRLVAHPEFYFFDVGVYRTLRPMGHLDTPEEVDGISYESLFLQELLAINDYLGLKYKIYYWRTSNNVEVDFVLYGVRGLKVFEVKRKGKITNPDLCGLKAFLKDYPTAKAYCIYGGKRQMSENNIDILPLEYALKNLDV